MKNNAIYIKIFGDAIIPILGFFLWNWSLYFIVLFYVLDVLVSEALVHLKTKKIKSYSEKINQRDWIKLGVKSGSLLLLLILLIHLTMMLIHPGIQFDKEFVAFLSYKDMGMEQGYILVPLIIFMGYASYQGEFIKPKLFTVLEPTTLWKEHTNALLLLNVFTLICLVSAAIILLPEWVFLCSIILSTTGFQFWKFRISS